MNNWLILLEKKEKEKSEDESLLLVEDLMNKLSSDGRSCDRIVSESVGIEVWQLLNFEEDKISSLTAEIEQIGEYKVQMWSRNTQASLSLVGVEGMTCGSCVKLIEGGVGDMEGVSNIKVFLDKKLSITQHNYSMTSMEQISSTIYDMGFDVEIMSTHILSDNSLLCDLSTDNQATNDDDEDDKGGDKNEEEEEADEDESFNLGINSNDKIKICKKEVNKNNQKDKITKKNKTNNGKNDYKSIKTNPTNNLINNNIKNNGNTHKRGNNKGGRKTSVANVGSEGRCYLEVEGMTCGSCVAHIEKYVVKQEGEWSGWFMVVFGKVFGMFMVFRW